MKVHLRMLGCRLNQSEIDTLARQFEQQGHQVVDSPETADQVIVNTCAVTHDAVKTGRRLVRDLHRANAQAEITVTGCHAQLAPQEMATLPGVVRVVGNREKAGIVQQITGAAPQPFDLEPHERRSPAGRTRAFVKVQDGCDNACTFCITTVARGAGISRPADNILNEIAFLLASGYQEVVLTGVHLGSYGHDLGQRDGLRRLAARILAETDVPRLRLSSLEPWDLTPEFFELWQDERLCPHLHLPLQSGCDATLRRMRRNTTTAQFADLVASARRSIPQVSITTDMIVGFPGETDEEFNESLAFADAMQFAGMHVFRYSVRPGTPAARMRGQVADDVRRSRSAAMIALAQAGEERFMRQQLGGFAPVLWEQVAGATPEGFVNVGYTHHYLRVKAVHPRPLTNLTTPTLLQNVQEGVLLGQPVLE
jgi:threonylcarbamoyladenosine tRNA methylthiotransferase MtaB